MNSPAKFQNYNDMKDRIQLLKEIVSVDDEANRVVTWHEIAEVWAYVEMKPRFVNKGDVTEQIMTYTVMMRKREMDFQAIRINGKIMTLKVPAKSDRLYTYAYGEVNV